MRGLMPREHGAYAQLGYPLVTGLVLASGDPGALAFAAAAVAAFLAHEPLAVLLGARGVRVREALLGDARRRLWVLVTCVLAAAVLALVLAPARAWLAALPPLVLGAVVVPVVLAGRIKTLPGEALVSLLFATLVLPLAMSGGATGADAVVASAVWAGAFLPSIVAVHAVKAAHKGRPRARWLVPATPALALLVAAGAVVAALQLPYPAGRALALLPGALAVLAVGLVRPHPRHLKRIGWTMAAAYTVILAFLLVL